MTVFHLFFSPKGRMNRAKYILATLLWIVIIAGGFALFAVMRALPESTGAWILIMILSVPIGWSMIVLGIKRLHDRNRTGWWMVPVYLVPQFLDRASSMAERDGNLILQVICIALGVAVALWIFAEFFCLRGTIGPNQYGDDPVARDISTK